VKRSIALVSALLSSLGATAAASATASAEVPGGNGLVDFGTLTCPGIGDVSLAGPRGPKAASGYLVETGQHVIATELAVTFTDLDGNVFSFSQSYGQKAAFTTFTCTQHFEEPDGSGDLTVTIAVAPPE
jgi:hypothetical protein